MEMLPCLVFFIVLSVQGASGDCMLGNPLNSTSQADEIGHFLDLDQPASCSGILVAWHFCYYADAVPLGTSTAFFRVWRPEMGSRYTRVAGQKLTLTLASLPLQPPGTTVCSSYNLMPEEQLDILEGDILAVYLQSSMTSVPVLASLPSGSGRQLFRDIRGFFDVKDSLQLRRNELVAVDDMGMHLYADIQISVATQSVSSTSDSSTIATSTTSTTSTISTITTSTSTSTSTSTTIAQEEITIHDETAIQEEMAEDTTGNTEQGDSAIIVVLSLIAVAVLVAGILFVVFVVRRKRNMESLDVLDCLKMKGRSNVLALDNAVYRVRSQHIAPLFSKSPSHSKKSSSTYEYPADNAATAVSTPASNIDNAAAAVSAPDAAQRPGETLRSNASYASYASYASPPVDIGGGVPTTLRSNTSYTSYASYASPPVDIGGGVPTTLRSNASYVSYASYASPPVDIGGGIPATLTSYASYASPPVDIGGGIQTTLRSNASYDSPPGDITDSTTYSIPTSLPAMGCDYVNHTIETHVTVEQDPYASDSQCSVHDEVEVEVEVERRIGGGLYPPVGDQRVVSGEYIYMDTCCPESEVEYRDGGSVASRSVLSSDMEEYIGPEDYQARLVYDSIQYRTLLQQATRDSPAEESPYMAPPSREDEIYIFISQLKVKVIARNSITVTEVIGSGHFGSVDKGQWKSIKKNTTLDVALKTLSSNTGNAEDKVKLLQEALIMGQFSHPNVVQFYGVIPRGEPLVLVMEYMEKRDLKKYLLQLRPQLGEAINKAIPGLLLGFSEQVALGMHYLASKRLVHRDLAARNVLVSKDDICKIGDFGMAKDISENGYYIGNDAKVPLKWTAPEVMSLRKYSTASDVWSYGCLLYEIWSCGAKPFKGLKNEEAIVKINSGYRLPPPPGCPQAIYGLMIQCWHPSAASRPKHQGILTSLLEDPKKVLHIPQCDASSHSLACLLGSPLAAGLNMYPDLQATYGPNANKQEDPDYEYMNNDSDDSQ